ncbi:MAG: thymidylate synthase [Candidatus Woesearchaeota archaeon]
MNWPIYFKHNLDLGNTDSCVAICTLWTEKEQLEKKIPRELYAIIGNLYSEKGITYLVKNVLANPNIRHIIIFGQDMAKSGQKLIELSEGKKISTSIDEKYLEIFRKQAEIIDLRQGSFDELLAKLKSLSLKKTEAFSEKPVILEDEKNTADEMQSENVNFVVREKQIADAWPKMLDIIMKFGEIKETQYGMKEKEILNMIAVIQEEKQELKSLLKISEKELQEYLPTVLTAKKPVGINYTYGERLFSYKVQEYPEIDQIKGIIEQLKETPFTRRAVAITWNVEKDRNSKHPPCLVYHHFIVRHGKLYLTAVIRSNDIFKAWPLNAFALNELLKYVCKETKLSYGNLTIISNSAHIYETDWEEAKKLIKETMKQNQEFVIDPRGYFVIYLKDNKIIAEHFTNEQKDTGQKFSGEKASEIYSQIISANLVSRQDHAAYLGKELYRAEQCLKNNTEFRQDIE